MKIGYLGLFVKPKQQLSAFADKRPIYSLEN